MLWPRSGNASASRPQRSTPTTHSRHAKLSVSAALGELAVAPKPYGELATAVRRFVGSIVGPSIELLGPSIELLKYEGLVAANGGSAKAEDAVLDITEAGRREFTTLLTANLRNGATEINKLVTSLKFRFLHLLEPAVRRDQAALLCEATANELARLEALRRDPASGQGYLGKWLDSDIALLETRLGWLERFARTLDAKG